MLQSAEQLRRGGDFIAGFSKSSQQVVPAHYPCPTVPADWVARAPPPSVANAQGVPGAGEL